MNNYYTLQELARINIEAQLKAGQAAQLYKRSNVRKHNLLTRFSSQIQPLIASVGGILKAHPETKTTPIQLTNTQCPECS